MLGIGFTHINPVLGLDNQVGTGRQSAKQQQHKYGKQGFFHNRSKRVYGSQKYAFIVIDTCFVYFINKSLKLNYFTNFAQSNLKNIGQKACINLFQ